MRSSKDLEVLMAPYCPVPGLRCSVEGKKLWIKASHCMWDLSSVSITRNTENRVGRYQLTALVRTSLLYIQLYDTEPAKLHEHPKHSSTHFHRRYSHYAIVQRVLIRHQISMTASSLDKCFLIGIFFSSPSMLKV